MIVAYRCHCRLQSADDDSSIFAGRKKTLAVHFGQHFVLESVDTSDHLPQIAPPKKGNYYKHGV